MTDHEAARKAVENVRNLALALERRGCQRLAEEIRLVSALARLSLSEISEYTQEVPCRGPAQTAST